jgi:predicted nucleotidyltransferase
MEQGLPILDKIIALVTSKTSPERIVLFGSYARGDNTENSDIDILIIIKDLVNERKITRSLYKALLDEDFSIPVDFLAIDYDKYNIVKNKIGYIYKTIEQEGKIIYGK